MSKRLGIQIVKLVTTLTSCRNQLCNFENIEVLRDCLATRGHLMFGRQARTDFKECLSIPCGQLIEDRSPGRVCQGLEDIAQPGPIIGKLLLACQETGATSLGIRRRARLSGRADGPDEAPRLPPRRLRMRGPVRAAPSTGRAAREPQTAALPWS